MNPEQRNDLSTLSEESLSVKDTSTSPTSKRVSIAQVLEAGLLIPGETLVWDRSRKGERWVATVTAEGKLRMDVGAIGQRSFTDGRLLAGQPFDGKLRSILDVGFRENVADTIAYRTFA